MCAEQRVQISPSEHCVNVMSAYTQYFREDHGMLTGTFIAQHFQHAPILRIARAFFSEDAFKAPLRPLLLVLDMFVGLISGYEAKISGG